jgi:hypothetical protein
LRPRIIVALALLAFCLLFPPAALAGSGEAVGENIGELLKAWASAIFTGVAALISLVFLLNRRYNELALFILAAVLVGGFVFAPVSVAETIQSIWQTITR